MHLKTLSVKGFKSFAGATTFTFEPGMTAVVGPNGSGKSNVVDAISWVLGEQGAKALRGGQMSDVIFAGTAGRPALGRAEVTLTIDNADGALPVEYAEVSVSRLLYRSGMSEYAINGTPCRLLDVQELMSDSGIGRELHVIVGQGQLDAVLQARPEDRRAFVEEAAGVLKHRKRKEKALRKVESTAVNLARLSDLTAELRRQLGPLGRQAEIARRAGAIQAALRDARLRLLADDLLALTDARTAESAGEAAAATRRGELETELTVVRTREAALETGLAAAGPALARAQELHFRLSGTAERLRGLQALAGERARHLAEPAAARSGRDPAETEAEAAEVRAAEAQTYALLGGDRERLEGAGARRRGAEEELTAADRQTAVAARATADRREGLARLAGESTALQARVEGVVAEIAMLTAAVGSARRQAAAAGDALAAAERAAGALDDGEVDLDARHERAAGRLAEAEAEAEAALDAQRVAQRDRAAAAARADALGLALAGRDGGAAALAGLPGVREGLATLLTVRPGYEAAVAAALGFRADALVVSSLAVAADALARLRADDGGRAALLVAGGPPAVLAPAPAGTVAIADVVGGPAEVVAPVVRLLTGTVVVADLDAARAVLAADPTLRAVTRAGDVLAADWADGGAAGGPSALEVRATRQDALAQAAAAADRLAAAESRAAAAGTARAAAAAEVATALAALHSSDARMAATTDELAGLGRAADAAHGEVERGGRRHAELTAAHETDLARLADLRDRLAAAAAEPVDAEPDLARRPALAAAAEAARGEEVEARLAVRTGEERVRALTGRAEQLERAAAAERAARDALAAATRRRQAGAQSAVELVRRAATAVVVAETAVGEAAGARDDAARVRAGGEGELLAVRSTARGLAEELDVLRDAAARDEVARAEQRLRIEALEARAAQEHGVDAAVLLTEYGPTVAVPPDADAGPDARATPYDREVQERRARQADRQLTQLGRVNPLALEEFTAMEERHAFLAGQLEDLTRTRRDLLGIVGEVDDHIREVFRSAYEDTAREFEDVFAVLFPGGVGRLELTEPGDLMATGIEVHARPAGKKVSRLSLLSGGERSLAAIALLVAIFRARPSPFYVFDEIEAALDDRNLQRLLQCLDGLREQSQLIVVTHQKRTMEIADALYGVSMRGDGISQVISQRLRDVAVEPRPVATAPA